MKFSLIIDKEREEEVIVYAREKNDLSDAIERLVNASEFKLFGINAREELISLAPDEIFCFFVEDNKVYAMREKEKLLIKHRLYRLEEEFPRDFLKINQSCLINVDKIAKFSSSISGALSVTLKNGYKDYISRRQLKTVKERIGI